MSARRRITLARIVYDVYDDGSSEAEIVLTPIGRDWQREGSVIWAEWCRDIVADAENLYLDAFERAFRPATPQPNNGDR